MADEREKEKREPRYQWKRDWFPLRMAEAMYRVEDGESICWMVPDDPSMTEGQASNRVMANAKSFAARLGIAVKCKAARLIVEDDATGREVVRRVVVLTPSGNTKAIAFRQLLERGETADAPEFTAPPPSTPVAEGAAELPRRRGRQPVIKTEEDRRKWEAIWAKRDAEKAGKK